MKASHKQPLLEWELAVALIEPGRLYHCQAESHNDAATERHRAACSRTSSSGANYISTEA
jgi:hypothetical protein